MRVDTPFRGPRTIAVILGGLLALTMTLPAGAEPAISGPHALPPIVGGNPNNTAPYAGLACVDSTDCTVVGPGYNEAVGDATALSEVAGQWGTPVAITLPDNAASTAGGGFSALNSVDCWSVGNCVAVGDYGVAETVDHAVHVDPWPLAVDEVGGTWQTAQQISLPTSPDTLFGSLTAVSCDPLGDCTTVGFYNDENPSSFSSTPFAIVATQALDTTTWTESSDLPLPVGSFFVVAPSALSCSAATTCTAIEYGISDTDVGGFLTEQDGTWSAVTSSGKVKTGNALLTSLSCPTVGNCVAAGSTDGSTQYPVVESESSGTWSAPVSLPLPLLSPVTNSASLNAISCLTTTECVAVGAAEYGANDNDAIGFVAARTSAGWSTTLAEAPVKIGSADSVVVQLGVVQCFTLTSCTALGAAGTGTVNLTTHIAGFVDAISPSEALKVAGRPAIVKVATATTTTKVSFLPPTSDGGSRITSFTVTAKATREVTRTCATPGLSCAFTGVVKGKVYTVTVTAHNKSGNSAPSLPRTFVAK